MGKFVDLTGQRFGRLVVLSRGEDYISPSGKHTARWLCRCDCGKELLVLRNSLSRGQQSCGCAQRDSAAAMAEDLTGQRFGRLVALRRAPLPAVGANRERNGWLCQCDCGNQVVVRTRCLKSGDTQSCGCLHAEYARATVAEKVGQSGGTTISLLAKKDANKNSKTGVRGVHWRARENRFIARIGLYGDDIALGRYDTLEDAAKARKAAENELYGPILDAQEKDN